jgi:hypothetical protein
MFIYLFIVLPMHPKLRSRRPAPAEAFVKKSSSVHQSTDSIASKYRPHFADHISLLSESSEEPLEISTRFFLNFLLLASDATLASEVQSLGVIDRFFDLFLGCDFPFVTLNCAMILVELSYWFTLPISEDVGAGLAVRCSECFCQKNELLNESVMRIVGNFCLDYPWLANVMIEHDVLDNVLGAVVIDVRDIGSVVGDIGRTIWSIARNPFDPQYIAHVMNFVMVLLEYRFVDARVYGLRVLRELMGRNEGMEFPDGLRDAIISLSADKTRVVREMLVTVRAITDDEFLESLLTEDFLNNLALQVYYHPDDTGADIVKFMRFVLPITRPLIDDLIILFTFSALRSPSYRMIHHGLKLLVALCDGRPDFALDLAAAGICALLMPVLLQDADHTPARMAFDLLLVVGRTCEMQGIDLRTVPGFDDVATALTMIELQALPDDAARVKVTELQRYFYMDDLDGAS